MFLSPVKIYLEAPTAVGREGADQIDLIITGHHSIIDDTSSGNAGGISVIPDRSSAFPDGASGMSFYDLN